MTDREAFAARTTTRDGVYVCRRGTLHVRNHLAVRDVLRARPDLRDEYGAVKLAPRLTRDDIDTYIARKSDVLQKVPRRGGPDRRRATPDPPLNDPSSP